MTGKTKPWPHQVKAFEFAMQHRGCLLPLKMGRGKSLVAIKVAEAMQARSILIIVPATAMGVWPREFEYHSSIKTNVVVLNKKSDDTKAKIRRATDALIMGQAMGQPVAIVVNYETAIRPDFQNFMLKRLWDLIIADEIHRAKDPTGATGKMFGKLGFVGKRKLGLSGTPLPHSKLDAFSQFRFLDPRVFGMNYVEFRTRFAKMHALFPGKVQDWLNEEEFNEKFSSISFYDDGLGGPELPEYTDTTITCELSQKAQRLYDEMERELITEVEAGVVTAANALVKIIRLQQICSGFVKTEDEVIQDVDDAKENMLMGLLEDIAPGDPVVVFSWYKHDLAVARRVAERFGRRYGEISGDRTDLTEHSKMPDWVDLMGVQLQSGGVGIDLTRACYGIYYSPCFNGALMEQSLKRIHRPGQSRTCHFYRIVAENTIDRAVYGTLGQRQEVVDSVFEYLKMQAGQRPS